MLVMVARASDDSNILPGRRGAEHRRAAACRELHFPGAERGHLDRAAAQIDDLGFDAMLGEQAEILGAPQDC
jgi:hypothetical protein